MQKESLSQIEDMYIQLLKIHNKYFGNGEDK